MYLHWHFHFLVGDWLCTFLLRIAHDYSLNLNPTFYPNKWLQNIWPWQRLSDIFKEKSKHFLMKSIFFRVLEWTSQTKQLWNIWSSIKYTPFSIGVITSAKFKISYWQSLWLVPFPRPLPYANTNDFNSIFIFPLSAQHVLWQTLQKVKGVCSKF